jgi:hypothetical protein
VRNDDDRWAPLGSSVRWRDRRTVLAGLLTWPGPLRDWQPDESLPGFYRVDFTPLATDITGRPAAATIDLHQAGEIGGGARPHAPDLAADASTVLVAVRNADGLELELPVPPGHLLSGRALGPVRPCGPMPEETAGGDDARRRPCTLMRPSTLAAA